MFWDLAVYLVLAWAAVCTVLTTTYFGRVAYIAIRRRWQTRKHTPAVSSPG